MIKYVIAGSGSKGNATFIYSETTIIQIDMGLPLRAINNAISLTPYSLSDVKAIFITHEHDDHIKSLKLKAYKSLNIPTYAGEGTLKEPSHVVEEENSLTIGDLTILPLKTSHDANHPLGYLIFNGDERLLYMTDTGYIPDESLPYMVNADHYIIESNHDVRMLKESSRPISLKKRILGECGHLSNIDSANYIANLVGEKTKSITLAHLSMECNTPEKAIDTWNEVFKEKGLDIARYNLRCAPQFECIIGGDI